jgi:DNA-binding transcriptional LysR family regulator
MNNITLLQIESFLIVAKHLNCSKAARFLHISQPSLSKTIKVFESAIGRKLFDRRSHGLVLTETGEYLYQALDSIHSDLERVIDHAYGIEGDAVRRLRIVLPSFFDSDTTFGSIGQSIRSFSEFHRDIRVETILCDFKEQRQAVELGTADLAITLDFVLYGMDNIAAKRILKAKRYLAVAIGHPLTEQNVLDYSMLEKEKFFRVMNNGDEHMREILFNECRQYGFLPKSIEFVPNLMTFIHNVKEQKGVGICGYLRNYDSEYGIKFLPLPELEEGQYVVAAWRADSLTKEAKDFIHMI